MQKTTLISVVAVCVLAVTGFAGGAVTYAELSDTETAAVSVEAGTWTTTPAEGDATTKNQSAEAFGVLSIEHTATETDANDSNATPTATPTETTVETPSTTTETVTETPESETETSTSTPTPTETAATTGPQVDVNHPLENSTISNETTAPGPEE
jgi:predicted ribosomally synthesized peptide with SipW-like signal peptide